MASIARRRTPARKAADHRLEQALNDLHATKGERTLARQVFAEAQHGPKGVNPGTAHRRAMQAVQDSRAALTDTAAAQS